MLKEELMGEIHDIYDRIAKRCISLSTRCTVNLINGLFETEYPMDSDVTYNWTENTDDELRRTLADTIVTINGRYSYHIEFQMTKEGDIILRMLEYGFHHAVKSHGGWNVINFPEPMIIYLYDRESFPDEYELQINFGKQGTFLYKVPVFKYLNHPIDELDQKKLIVLLPFQLLKLRREIERERTEENINALKELITHDIMDSLKRNVDAGNITHNEAVKLSGMILRLYHHIYDGYEELESRGVNHMAEDALIFDVDILEYEIKKLTKANEELESKAQDFEAKAHNLETDIFHLVKLLARTYSLEEIAAQTGIPAEKIKDILHTEL